MVGRYTHRISAIEAIAGRIRKDAPAAHSYVHRLADVADQLKGTMRALGALYDTPDPTVTRAAHEKRVGSAANRLKEQVGSARDKLNAILQEGARDIDRRISEKVRLVPDAKYEAEIRSVYRSLDAHGRLSMLADLMHSNKGPELASIVCAPAVLTGITPEIQERFRTGIVQMHAGPEYEQQKMLMDSASPAFVATDVALEMAKDMSDPTRLASIERGEAAARDAEAAFVDASHTS